MNNTPYILLVDDDPDDLLLLRESIEGIGETFKVFECKDGRSALNYLKENEKKSTLPGLIVLDINMPILDGREMLAILKKDPVLKKIPTVVFTTSSNSSDFEYCNKFNVPLFTKPFNLSMLQEITKKILSYYEV